MEKITIGIIGNGFVGKATTLFKCSKINILVYDIKIQLTVPIGITLKDVVKRSDIVMICVPTPMKPTGESDTSIVEKCIAQVREHETNLGKKISIVVRSTVPVGFCQKNGVNHMPEFLTEDNWEADFRKCATWVVGIDNNDTHIKKYIKFIINNAKLAGNILSDTIRFVSPNTSEFVKYGKNCFLAVKLSLCNEYYKFCKNTGIEYDQAIALIGEDERIGIKYTRVPGTDGECGWSGTCLPKDTLSFVHQLHNTNTPSYIIEAAITRNTECDRQQHDWKDECKRGRTYI